MTKELIMLKQIDRIKELETVLLEIKAFMLNITELEEKDYNFLMQEIERVIGDKE